MQICFSKRVVETLKKWAPPRQVTFMCPPPGSAIPGKPTLSADNVGFFQRNLLYQRKTRII